MSEKLCEVCDRERTPIGEPGCHRHASFPGQAGYLECYRLGCERLPAALAAAEERGRRAGIEEAGRAVREAVGKWDGKGSNGGAYMAINNALRALAPRDSGKENA